MLSEQLNEMLRMFKTGERSAAESQGAPAGERGLLINWSEKYSVGDPGMDTDHKKLVRMINDMHAALREKRGNDVVQKLLDKLKQYVQYHFNSEEVLLAKLKYPGLAAQQAAHHKFLETVGAMEKRWQGGDKTVTSEMMKLLQVWLVDHIVKMDKQYTSYLSGAR